MAGVPLMAGEIDCPVERHREIQVDLYQAMVLALVPVVGIPGRALHVLEIEPLAWRQSDVSQRARPAGGDGRLEDGVDLGRRNVEPVAESLVAIGEPALA